MALANNPPNAPASAVEEKNNENRFCASLRLYHIPNR